MLDKSFEPDSYAEMTILCVDDEANVLRALQRLFHRKAYKILVSETAEEALLLLKENAIQVIISDMRMPKMDGVQLLEKVTQSYPDIYRIILSGYSDFESTVDAINVGKINRFINKPWNNHELIEVVEKGLESIKLKQENKRLKALIEQKNEDLKKWNNELEDKVSLRTKQIRAALQINERNNKASDKMLFNFIAIHPNLSGNFAKNVSQLAGRLAEELGLDKQEIYDIRLAGILTEIGMLSLDPLICSTPFTLLNYQQKKEFLHQGEVAQQILSPAQHIDNVRDIITHQYSPIKELKLSSAAMNGIKVLSVARDYWRYASGRILPDSLDNIHIRIELKKGKGTKYDEEVLKVLKEHPELVENIKLEKGITTKQLSPGMILKYNLYTTTHLLILAEGHEFSSSSIQHLIEYEKNQKHILSIIIESN
jgi:response regulator RpfG family c-di-GMP phosphodiesterase